MGSFIFALLALIGLLRANRVIASALSCLSSLLYWLVDLSLPPFHPETIRARCGGEIDRGTLLGRSSNGCLASTVSGTLSFDGGKRHFSELALSKFEQFLELFGYGMCSYPFLHGSPSTLGSLRVF